MMKNSLLRSPKKEEQLVPDSMVAEFFETNTDGHGHGDDILDQLESIMSNTTSVYDNHELDWDLMEWDCFSINKDDQESSALVNKHENEDEGAADLSCNIKKEFSGIWDDNDNEDRQDNTKKKSYLNLSLNYQEVLDAWSDRCLLLADDFAQSTTSMSSYMGEVPVMLEEDRTRREASVLRYKEKRQSRLFSKKIRYQVRKLNADKRPRFKGRFVKRES